jgi:tryptophan-rich sensory protein
MILVPLPYKLYGFFCLCLNMEKWKTFCTNRKVNRGWQIYFDMYVKITVAVRKEFSHSTSLSTLPYCIWYSIVSTTCFVLGTLGANP